MSEADLDALLTAGDISIEPIVYEDFLPVSAAGIFQSNLGEGGTKEYDGTSNRDLFERDLGASVQDELELYATTERQSIAACLAALNPQ